MNVSPVLELLRQKIGFNPESIGVASVEKSVREHIESSGAASVEDFVKKVNGSISELNKLIESVLVQETSFFRNKTPFVTLQNYLKQFVLHKKIGKTLRILCLPCSTGEEAYSIAMVLMDMRLAASQFFIFAGDISEQVLQIAATGRYDPYSFRGEDEAYKKKYFVRQPDGAFILQEAVRAAVHFERANILADNFLLGHEPYDVIFCRNLLIYFDADAKEKAINSLSKHLSQEGVLFVGHAEGSIPTQFGFASMDYPMSFAFARADYAARINDALNANSGNKNAPQPVSAKQKATKAGSLVAAKKKGSVTTGSDKLGEKEGIQGKSQVDEEISRAKRLADGGSFDKVTGICEILLSQGVESAEIYYLLGQASGSSGDNFQAEEYLKKAIYLDADFYDALIYMSFLADRMGNPDKAKSFRNRAQRVKLRKAGSGSK